MLGSFINGSTWGRFTDVSIGIVKKDWVLLGVHSKRSDRTAACTLSMQIAVLTAITRKVQCHLHRY
jgi:hypothetical protein